MLGYQSGRPQKNARYGVAARGDNFQVTCQGNERSIFDCRDIYNEEYPASCPRQNDAAGVECKQPVGKLLIFQANDCRSHQVEYTVPFYQ